MNVNKEICRIMAQATLTLFVALIVVLAFLLQKPTAKPIKPIESNCGYEACHPTNPRALNVHLVAHSHDDVGWLKTVDQYYYGSKQNTQKAAVQFIIDSYVAALRANPKRKFIQVETVFLWMWWREQSPRKRRAFKTLIENGQLEIAGGAWSMNDEATVLYQSTIDQFTLGLGFLQEKLGPCGRPTIGWQIDPFGHSSEMASLFAHMGYEAVFFARLDYRDRAERLQTKTAEMLWRGSANLGNSSILFTHVLSDYTWPQSFEFDLLDTVHDPLVADRESSHYNLDEKVKQFAQWLRGYMEGNYLSNHVLMPMGMDFAYRAALYSFRNIDLLIKGFEEFKVHDRQGRRIKLLYSTPACYLKAVNDYATEHHLEYKIKTDDFMPYASTPDAYWTGYYTSRPTQKRFERQGNNLLQIAKQLETFMGLYETTSLWDLKSIMGIMQHHDAISGTEKQHVADDYARMFFQAIDKTHEEIKDAIPSFLAKTDAEHTLLHFKSCLLVNITHCEESNKEKFVVAVYNPLSRFVSHYVRLPVNSTEFVVKVDAGNTIQYQITPVIADFSYVPNIKPSKYELVFRAAEIPPMGMKLYYVEKLEGADREIKGTKTNVTGFLGDDERLKVQLGEHSSYVEAITIDGRHIMFRQELMNYLGQQGWGQSSGAYIFRPSIRYRDATNFTYNISDNTLVYKGPLVDEAHQIFNDWNRQIVRVYKEENHVEFDWLVGPIYTGDDYGKEIITRFRSMDLTGDFYTDSNGREMIKRRNNFRATYDYTTEEPVAGNYYPVSVAASFRDAEQDTEYAVVTDRAQGAASLRNGQVELMVHRLCMRDDGKGVSEALQETEFGRGLVVRGQHYVTHGKVRPSEDGETCRERMRDVIQRKTLSPWVFISDASAYSYDDIQKNYKFEYSGLRTALPKDINILTLEMLSTDSVLLRLENVMEAESDYGDTIIDLSDLFVEFNIVSMVETSLAADRPVNVTKLKWNIGGCLPGLEDCDLKGSKGPHDEDDVSKLIVTLSPMEIRTFIATVEYKNRKYNLI